MKNLSILLDCLFCFRELSGVVPLIIAFQKNHPKWQKKINEMTSEEMHESFKGLQSVINKNDDVKDAEKISRELNANYEMLPDIVKVVIGPLTNIFKKALGYGIAPYGRTAPRETLVAREGNKLNEDFLRSSFILIQSIRSVEEELMQELHNSIVKV